MIQTVYFLVAGIASILGVLPLIFGNNKRVNALFFVIAMMMVLWILSVYHIITGDAELIWARMSFVGPIVGPTAVVYFLWIYPRFLPGVRSIHYLGLCVMPLILLGMVPTSLIVESIQNKYQLVYGLGHYLFAVNFFVHLVIIVGSTGYGLLRYTGIDRERVKYFAGGVLLTLFMIGITNIVFPLFGSNQYSQFGPLFSLCFLICNIYALLNHRFMSIDIVLRRTLFYSALVMCTSMLFFLGLLHSSQMSLKSDVIRIGKLSILISCATMVFLYPYMRKGFDSLTEALFYQDKYIYQDVIRELVSRFSHLINKNDIVDILIFRIPELMKVDLAALYICSHNNYFKREYVLGDSAIFVDHFELNDSGLSHYKSGQPFFSQRPLFDQGFKAHNRDFRLYGDHLIMPLVFEQDVLALWVLGPKRSDDIYTETDLSLLQLVASHSAASFFNAAHYLSLCDYVENIQYLNDMSILMSEVLDWNKLFCHVDTCMKSLFKFDHVIHFLIETKTNTDAQSYIVSNKRLISFEQDVFPSYDAFKHQVYLEPHILESEHEILQPFYQLVQKKWRIQQLVFVPFVQGKRLVGFSLGGYHKPRLSIHISFLFLKRFSQDVGSLLNKVLLYQKMVQAKIYHEDLLQHMMTGIILFDSSLRITGFNKTAENITGCVSETVIGQPISCLYVVNDAFSIIEDVTVFQQEETVEAFFLDDGKKIPYSITVSVMEWGSKTGGIVILSNMKTLKMLQKQAEQANRLSSLGLMATGVAQEIDAPLEIIRTHFHALPDRFEDELFRDQYLTQVPPQIDQINQMCESLLKMGRSKPKHLEAIDVNSVFQEVTFLVSGAAKMHSGDISVQTNTLPMIYADRSQIVQIVLNLVVNGLQSLPEEGGQVFVSAQVLKGVFEIEIKDTGKGMDSYVQSKMFDPFFTCTEGSIGLGLSIVYNVVEEMGGQVMVHSQVDLGTTVRLMLPILTPVSEKVVTHSL